MDMGKLQEPVIFIRNTAGDTLAFHRRNPRRTTCAECQAPLAMGHGCQRKMHHTRGSGFLCHRCAGDAILKHPQFMYNRFSATLSPFDGVYSCYALPAQELAQAWADHGASGLRFAAETLREQARENFLIARDIPYTPEKTYSLAVMA